MNILYHKFTAGGNVTQPLSGKLTAGGHECIFYTTILPPEEMRVYSLPDKINVEGNAIQPLFCKLTAEGNVTQPLPCKFTAGGYVLKSIQKHFTNRENA